MSAPALPLPAPSPPEELDEPDELDEPVSSVFAPELEVDEELEVLDPPDDELLVPPSRRLTDLDGLTSSSSSSQS